MHFTRLRLHGFKSFVDATDLEIPEGLTGIVGPNGCGKSNLVEALRWVMGENSARRMRGADMDDVIFAGTTMRPSRNLAEVALELDNSTRSAAGEFNNDDILRVTRKIERGGGSDYRVNGRPARQRDIQLLFADQATGAHSTNLVGQGQIDALIRAKPQDRRQILEEASGTAGLQSRRHEAELKLKSAEQNLTRVDDVLKAHDTQLRSLKQQVKQASRYRNLAEHMRRAEAALLHIRWTEAEKQAERLAEALANAAQSVNDLTSVVTRGTTARVEKAAELPGLRQAETVAAAITQKLMLERDRVETELRRVGDEVKACASRLAQAQGDLEREQSRRADGEAALVRLEDEQVLLVATQERLDGELPSATQGLLDMTREIDALDTSLAQFMQEVASVEARRAALGKEVEAQAARKADLSRRRVTLDQDRGALAAEAATRPDLVMASALVEACDTELARRQQQAQAAETSLREAEAVQVAARELAHETLARATRLKAEADALSDLLRPHDNPEAEQIVDAISVTPGLENALAIALGEALTASFDTKAASHWRSLPAYAEAQPLPDGAMPLAGEIKAPEALARCLSQIGLVEDAAAGEHASAALRCGQTIVSRDGWAWRWDGFTVTPQAKTATAIRLQQRNRLAALLSEREQIETEAQAAQQALDDSAAVAVQHKEAEREAQDALKAAYRALNDARADHTRQEKDASGVVARLAALDGQIGQIDAELEQVRHRAAVAENDLAILPDLESRKSDMATQRAALAERRALQAEKRSAYDRLSREQESCAQRRAVVEKEAEAWRGRISGASQQVEALRQRMIELEKQSRELEGRPLELERARAQLLTELSEAESKRKDAADRLIVAEQDLAEVESQLRRDESALAAVREERVRIEAAAQAAAEHFNVLRQRIEEKLNCGPGSLRAIAEIEDGAEIPELEELEQVLARYTRERDGMGPVNLRAEVEAETLEKAIDKLQKEKDDLSAAIAKLRQGISQLNREARERLQGAFGLVNERFQKLFGELFDGGRAHLELIDDEDPMNAGLEIFASPPGKKMQILSLLSGGERTLTALALLFAVFQTNPSPICVLDEAEAALDESNIERFCQLVKVIAAETGTRFLIITHHRVTMAHMDRLYGVTMGEKGVSQLVSVDLSAAVALREGSDDAFASAEVALADVRAA
ncbi:MAG: chromosome segregation protein SMC [Bdellovibrionales bacterium]